MSLYDSYQLANSSVVPMYEGSNGQEAIKAAEYRQGRYDVAQQGLGTLSDNLPALSASADPLSRKMADDYTTEIRNKIDQISKRNDLENTIPQIQSLGRRYANDAIVFNQNAQAMSAYQKSLDKWDGKPGEELSPEQKKMYMAITLGKTEKDANGNTIQSNAVQRTVDGHFVSRFRGEEPAGNVSMPKIVDEALKDRVIHKYGSEYYQRWADGGSQFKVDKDGNYYAKIGDKWEQESIGKVDAILKPALDSNEGFQAVKQRERTFAEFNAKHSDVNKVLNQPDSYDSKGPKGKTISTPNYTKLAIQNLIKQGMAPEDAYAKISGDLASNTVERQAYDYAGAKYAQNDHQHTEEVTADKIKLKGIQEGGNSISVVGTGSATPTGGTNGDIHTMTTTAQTTAVDANNTVTALQKQIDDAKAKGADVSNLTTQLEQAKSTAKFSNDQAARLSKMQTDLRNKSTQDAKIPDGKGGYVASYDELVNGVATRAAGVLSNNKIGAVTIGNDTLTSKELADAVLSGKLKMEGTSLDNLYTTYTDKKGNTVKLTPKQEGVIRPIIGMVNKEANGSKLNSVNAAAATNASAAAKNSSYQPTAITTADKNLKEVLENVVRSGSGTIMDRNGNPLTKAKFTDGSGQFVYDGTLQSDGTILGHYEWADKSDPTAVKIDISHTNAATVAAEHLSKNIPNFGNVASQFAGAAKDLYHAPDNQNVNDKPLVLPNGTKVNLFKYNDGKGKVEFQLRDIDGKDILKRNDGSTYTTNDIQKVTDWMDHLSGVSDAEKEQVKAQLNQIQKAKHKK